MSLAAVRNSAPSAWNESMPVEWSRWFEVANNVAAEILKGYLSQGSRFYDIGSDYAMVGPKLTETMSQRNVTYNGVVPDYGSGVTADDYYEIWGNGLDFSHTVSLVDLPDFAIRPYDAAAVMFVSSLISPVERRAMFTNLWNALSPGGAIVVVDKSQYHLTMPAIVIDRLSSLDFEIKSLAEDSRYIRRPLSRVELPSCSSEFFRLGDYVGWIAEKPVKAFR